MQSIPGIGLSSTLRNQLFGLLSIALLGSSACGGFGDSAAGDFGATQGGVQDMRFARDLVANGQVPLPAAFVVEGMFSEHDLGLSGAPCETLLCLRSAVAVAPTLDGEPAGWMQIGMSSTIDPEAFERPSLTLIATVDVSGSMGWSYADEEAEYPTAGALTRNLLGSLTAQLGAQDRIAIVTYGSSVDTRLPLTAGDQKSAIEAAIGSLDADGSTNMEAGLERAYAIAREAAGDGVTDQTRIVLFTDVQPNVGASSASAFEQMVTRGTDDGVGITVLGLGLGLGQEIMNAMSHVRGGNAFSFTRRDDTSTFMKDNWPWFVSPIAYDLSMTVATTEGVTIRDSYGFPEGTEEATGFDVSTVFLSRRKGALLLSIRPPAPVEGEDSAIDAFGMIANLRYTTLAGEVVEQQLDAAYQGQAVDERGHYYEQPSTGKTVALALLVSGMHEAAALYAGGQAAAVARMTAVRDRFAADAERLADETLAPELQLAQDLLALMEQGAAQGSLYPY